MARGSSWFVSGKFYCFYSSFSFPIPLLFFFLLVARIGNDFATTLNSLERFAFMES
jgi:hypothetical protein